MSLARFWPVPLAAVLLVLAFPVLAGFSPLAMFDLVVPKDGGSELERDIAYGSEARQQLDVYRPEAEGSGRPVVLFLYGGSWNSGSKDDYSFVGRALAAQGFVTVVADYRLVPAVRYPAFIEDGAAALAWIGANIEAHGGNPERIAVVGHSAGAYIAAMLALEARYVEDAGFEGTITALAGLSGPFDFLPLDAESTIAAFGEAADLAGTQPINHARPDAPPALFLHGEDDTLVYPRNSVALAEALTGAGAHAALRLYPGVDHAGTLLAISRWFRGEEGVFTDLVQFLRQHV